MSFFKSLFAKKQALPTRSLDHASQLQLRDLFTFSDSFALPQAMRKMQLQVNEINTLEFKHEHYAQVIGQGAGSQLVYLSFPSNPQQLVKLSLLLTRDDVETLFDMDDFSEIFEAPGKARLKPLTNTHNYADMIADEYIQQDFMTTGYLHRQDYRGATPPQYNEDKHGQEFEFYSLQGGQEKRFIDIFIFENGDTDVYLSFLRPANEIAELWIKE
ncbi:hypothetical protein [Psychromonas sp. Urea-02u-13]|uniref:hypothetical protein n=1 Tax=Psychromonas sp. Urea-02u-13 TaxID=2058326 RepID=UPI000C324383|nr:hypothetical protein [Psychromonas sp. Urea-02u-13]PKG40718.1 hypothetical protein CXF74_01720 [Psychromonas sp. Urea-02u-13]